MYKDKDIRYLSHTEPSLPVLSEASKKQPFWLGRKAKIILGLTTCALVALVAFALPKYSQDFNSNQNSPAIDNLLFRTPYGTVKMSEISPLREKLKVEYLGNVTSEEAHLPTFSVKVLPWDSIGELYDNNLYYSKESYKKFLKTPKVSIQTKSQLDSIVKQLSKERFFGWSHLYDGCSYRALLTQYTLEAMSVDKKTLVQQHVKCDPGMLGTVVDNEVIEWIYHTAAAVILPNNEKYILDPSINPEKSLTYEDWFDKIHFKSSLGNCKTTQHPFKSLKANGENLGGYLWFILQLYRDKIEGLI